MPAKSEIAGIGSSILRLRDLREKLCANQKTQTSAREMCSFLIGELEDLHDMICDRRVRRKKLEDRSLSILKALNEAHEHKFGGDENA